MDIIRICSLLFLISTSLAQDVEPDSSFNSIDELHYQSVITHRFATTHVTSQLKNTASSLPRQAIFSLRLPKEAFISNFTMTIEGVVYPGVIDDKENAKKKYEAAVERGESASHVAASSRDTNKFAVSVNVAANESVTFSLVYQELLARKAGLYEHVIYINPGVSVPDLWVDVYIFETNDITDLNVPQLSNDLLTDVVISDSNQIATVEILSTSSAHITFIPSIDEQLEFSDDGISGQFIVNYDVDHNVDEAGEILVSNGYFIHYFAPVWLKPMSKRLLFVLDTSGSMSGKKIKQLKVALLTILDDLRPEDEFGILTFSSSFHLWNSGELIPASEKNVVSARQYAANLIAQGGTDINGAILRGLDLVSGNTEKPAMLLFLSDGEATSGITNSKAILDNIQNANRDVSIFSLAFGRGADYDLVRKISARNNGVARKIYEDADASLQLAGFYDEISSPLLSDIQVTYIGDSIDNETLTKTDLHCFFEGTEMIIAGKIDLDNGTAPTIDLKIEGRRNISNIIIIEEEVNVRAYNLSDIPIPSPFEINDFTERLWVYLTVKQLIDTTLQATDLDRVEAAKKKALELSLQYNFVTPYTSMVVTKPDQNKEVIGDTPSWRPRPPPSYSNYGRSGPSYSQPSRTSGPFRSSGPYAMPMYHPIGSGSGLSTVLNVPRPRPTRPAYTQVFPSYRVTSLPRLRSTTKSSSRDVHTKQHSATPNKGNKANKGGSRTRAPSGERGTPTATTGYPPALTFEVELTNKVKTNHSIVNNSTSLCMDIPEEVHSAVELTLAQNKKEGLLVNGRLSKPYKEGRKFEEVVVTHRNTTIRVNVKGVQFIPEPTRPWWQLKHVNKTGLRVSPEGRVEISLGKDFSIMVRKHGIQSRRSRARPFLTVSFDGTGSLSKNTGGLIGEILKLREVKVTENSRLWYRKDRVSRKTISGVELYKLSETSQCYRVKEKTIVKNILNL